METTGIIGIIMENQTEKNMENEMETGVIEGLEFRVYECLLVKKYVVRAMSFSLVYFFGALGNSLDGWMLEAFG